MPTSKRFLGFSVRTWWTLVIAVAVSCVSSLLVVSYLSDRSNRQFRHTILLGQVQYQQATSISNRQSSYSINKIVCGFRGFIVPTLKSYEAAAKDPTLSQSARARNDKRIRTTRAYLSTLVTVPADFDCAKLPKNPPKAANP